MEFCALIRNPSAVQSALVFILSAFVVGHADSVRAQDLPITSCETQLGALNDRFSAEYVTLDSECYPSEGQPIEYSCGFELSVECQAKYEALGAEANSAYEAFYQDCPDYGVALPVGDGAVVFNLMGKNASAPVTKAPTKKEMLVTIRQLKKKLRRAEVRMKKTRGRCAR